MKVRRFDPDDDLIIVKARVFGRQGARVMNLALDTAASHTHILPDIVDELGYRSRFVAAFCEALAGRRRLRVLELGSGPGHLRRVGG